MAVDPVAAGRGVGTRVVEAATAELARRGVAGGEGRRPAPTTPPRSRLYARCGFAVAAATIAVHEGTPSEVLVWRSS